jgi:transcriptional regulator of acetoin/glycerol metabolism
LTVPCEGNNPDLWFSEAADEERQAKEACGFCPVRAECAELGADEEFGVWGGLNPDDRRAAKRLRVLKIEERINAKIRKLSGEGMSISGMARELGIPRKTLADRLRRMTALVA